MFMHMLNPQLRQVARTMVISGDLEEVIEIVKKATVYGEDKSGSSQTKTETNKNGRMEERVARKTRVIGGPSGGPKGKVQVISGDSH